MIGFKSARKEMAFGIGERGKPMSEATCYEKLRSLEKKGCLRIVGTEHKGTRVEVRLPSEVTGVMPPLKAATEVSLEEMDFFDVAADRQLILARDGGRCFYCLRSIDSANFVIDHLEKRRMAGNGYRNVVAACRACNNRKGELAPEDYLRYLYRDGVLSQDELTARVKAIEDVRSGTTKPAVPPAGSAASLSNREHR